ncbi:MAG: thioredoxin domain-containing protein [Planctomycetes bacterium]|nr:thioredoxin domain-containing protein [Planctomycetota bacterium]
MRVVLLILCLLGTLACGVLLRMSVPSDSGDGISQSLCKPTARINCDYVLASRWAKVGPLPSAAVGLLYFLSLGSWFTFVGLPNGAGRRWHRVPMLLCVVGILASVYYTLVMAAYLPVWCTWCLGVHGINAILCIACVLAARPTCAAVAGQSAYPSAARAWGVIGGTAGVSLLIASFIFGFQMQVTARRFQLDLLKATNNADYILWRHSQNARHEIALRPDEFVIGRADAPHVVVAYTDFECSACAGFHRYAARLTNLYPDAVRIAFRHFPLDRTCNTHSTESMHVFACEAARAAEAARSVGSWESTYRYHQLVFENAARLAEQPYKEFAQDSKLDSAKWAIVFEGEDATKRIAADIESAHALGVEGTPAIFLDGRRLDAWHLLTTDASPKVDLDGTDRLWGRLVGAQSK